jgi:hypothetical protein
MTTATNQLDVLGGHPGEEQRFSASTAGPMNRAPRQEVITETEAGRLVLEEACQLRIGKQVAKSNLSEETGRNPASRNLVAPRMNTHFGDHNLARPKRQAA